MNLKTMKPLLLSLCWIGLIPSSVKADENLSTVAIYQLENSRDHLYSADPDTDTDEADGAYHTHSDDEDFDLLKVAEPGAVLLYSCKESGGLHVLSMDAECGGGENANEETLGYMQTAPSDTLQFPLYRCSPLLGDIFTTEVEDCAKSPGGITAKPKIFGYVDVPPSELPPSIPNNPGDFRRSKP
jgi:hypothetical protein